MNHLKALMEKRDELKQNMDALVDAADAEQRALSGEEAAAFDAAEQEIRAIDETVERQERARRLDRRAVPSDKEERAAAGDDGGVRVSHIVERGGFEHGIGGDEVVLKDEGDVEEVEREAHGGVEEGAPP